jgi:long-chain acyl-CoA synthetase
VQAQKRGDPALNLATNIVRAAQFYPDKAAILFEGSSITYRDVDQQSNRVAHALLGLGIGRGDRVALYLPNIPEFAYAYLGILKVGAVAVSVNAILKSDEVAFILNDSGARSLFTTQALLANVTEGSSPTLESIVVCDGDFEGHSTLTGLMSKASSDRCLVAMESNDPALILYTSGTTGFPKGATLSHGNVVSNTWATVHHCGYRPEDRLLLCLPLFHVFGQNFIMNSCFVAGATLVLHRRFEPDVVLNSIARERVTMLFGVPTIYVALLNADLSRADLSSIRYEFSAAATMPREISRQWTERFGRPVFEGYGLTETSPFAAYNHDLRHKFGSVGSAVENFEIKIIDEEGQEPPLGDWGEIAIKGPGVMLGYWNRLEDTAAAIQNGWFRSGDTGAMDDEGYIFIVDRIKDMINRSGLKIWPAEVEQLLYRYPAVKEAAVYGIPDEHGNEAVAAAIVLKQGFECTAGEIIAYCRGKAAVYKAPSVVQFMDALPKNATGKILKRVLREAVKLDEASSSSQK